MALKKTTPSAAFNDTSSADTGSGTATMERPAETPQADPVVTATTAIAKASGSSIGAVNESVAAAKAFKKEVEAMQGAADFTYGSHRVFKAADGEIKEMQGDKLVLGKWVKARLLAWDRHFEISPGEEGASSGPFVAYSKDGVTIDNVIGEEQKAYEGTPVADYLKYLREEEDFDKASRREFVDLQVAVMGSESEPDFVGVIQVTLASSSIPAFRKYQSDLEATAKCVAMNLAGYSLPADPFTFYLIREAAEKGKNRWTKIRIASTLPAKV